MIFKFGKAYTFPVVTVQTRTTTTAAFSVEDGFLIAWHGNYLVYCPWYKFVFQGRECSSVVIHLLGRDEEEHPI